MDLDKGRRMEGYDLYRIFVCEMRKNYEVEYAMFVLAVLLKKFTS